MALCPSGLSVSGGDNLLDDDVRNHVSFKKDEVLLPGRSVRLFGSIKLN